MPSVDSTALEEEIAPGKYLMLHSYWESWKQEDGQPGLTNITISVVEQDAEGDFLEDVILLDEDVEEWRDGDFVDEDVIKKFGPQFFHHVQKERTKSYMKTLPPVGGRGRGWHGEHERHRQAAIKGKLPAGGVYQAPRLSPHYQAPDSMRWRGQSAVMGVKEGIEKRKR